MHYAHMVGDAAQMLRSSAGAVRSFTPVPGEPPGYTLPDVLGLAWSCFALIEASAELALRADRYDQLGGLYNARLAAEVTLKHLDRAPLAPWPRPRVPVDGLAVASAKEVKEAMLELATVLEPVLDELYEYRPGNDDPDAKANRCAAKMINIVAHSLREDLDQLTR